MMNQLCIWIMTKRNKLMKQKTDEKQLQPFLKKEIQNLKGTD